MDFASYFGNLGLFGVALSAFLSSTILPGTSEAAVIAYEAAFPGRTAALFLTATLMNTAGAMTSWALGRFIPEGKKVSREAPPLRNAASLFLLGACDRGCAVAWRGAHPDTIYSSASFHASWERSPVRGNTRTVFSSEALKKTAEMNSLPFVYTDFLFYFMRLSREPVFGISELFSTGRSGAGRSPSGSAGTLLLAALAGTVLL